MLPTKFRFICQSGFRGDFQKLTNQKQKFLDKLWRSSLLMNQDKMCNLYRGSSIDASYQISVHLAEGFWGRRLKCEKLTDDGCQVMTKAHFAFGKVS
jgi:hypothetical protein